MYNSRVFYVSNCFNLVPRALFPGFGGGAPKAREKRPGDEVAIVSAPYFLIFIFLVSWHTTSTWEDSRANAKVDYITAALSLGSAHERVLGRTVGSFHEQRLVIKRFAEG